MKAQSKAPAIDSVEDRRSLWLDVHTRNERSLVALVRFLREFPCKTAGFCGADAAEGVAAFNHLHHCARDVEMDSWKDLGRAEPGDKVTQGVPVSWEISGKPSRTPGKDAPLPREAWSEWGLAIRGIADDVSAIKACLIRIYPSGHASIKRAIKAEASVNSLRLALGRVLSDQHPNWVERDGVV